MRLTCGNCNTGTSTWRQLGRRRDWFSRFIPLGISLGPSSVVHLPIGGDVGGECLLARVLSSRVPACRLLPLPVICSLEEGSFSALVLRPAQPRGLRTSRRWLTPHGEERWRVFTIPFGLSEGWVWNPLLSAPAVAELLSGSNADTPQIPATWTLYGTQYINSDLSWRLPLWFQAIAAGMVLLGCLFCPETPRWVSRISPFSNSRGKKGNWLLWQLVSNDHHEEAIRVMARYHGEGDRNSPIVLLTYKEMIEEIATEGSDKRWWDYKDLFNSKSAWWRLSCVGGMAFFSQVCTNCSAVYRHKYFKNRELTNWHQNNLVVR